MEMMTQEEYGRRAAELMNRHDEGVEVYLHVDKLLVRYDPEKNEWAEGNERGELETYFQPRRGRDYVRRLEEAEIIIRLK